MIDGFCPWPDEFATHYRELGYWRGESLSAALHRYASAFADRPAIADKQRRLTYRELNVEVDRYAAGLHGLGIRSENRVVLQLPNRCEFVIVMFALLRIGAIPVFAMPAHREFELRHCIDGTDAVALVTADAIGDHDHRELAETVAAYSTTLCYVILAGDTAIDDTATGGSAEFVSLASLRREPIEHPPVDPSDVAVLLLSGGTTGLPKFVARTHDDWAYSGREVARACSYDTTTRHLVSLPLSHNWTLTHGLLATFHVGGQLVLADSPDPGATFPLIERHGVTDTGLVPGAALLWVELAPEAPEDLSSLRRVVIGGSKLPVELARRVEPALGCQLHQAFGMAEGLCGFQDGDDDLETRLHAQGKPVSQADELLVIDESGQPVPDGHIGELLTRGPYTIRGYFRGGVHNDTSFTPDGFYRSGDLVRLLPNGHLVFEGRVKDQINRGGEKISAEEVENHLLAHPSIRAVALVGIPDEVLGERSCAFVVLATPQNEGPTQPQIAQFLLDRGIAGYKIPDLVRTVVTLPRTAVGKVDKKALRETEVPA